MPFIVVGVGRSSGRQRKIKSVGLKPRIGAVRTDEDRDVSLEQDAFGVGILFHLDHLEVAEELEE